MRRSLRALVLTGLTIGLLGGDIPSLSFAPAAAEAHWRRGGGGYGYGYGFGYGRGGYYGHSGYYRHGASVGDVLATAAVIGTIAVVASSISRDRRADDRRDEGGWDDRDERRGSSRRDDRRDEVAVDECRDEAERQARRYGSSASIRDVYDIDSRGSEVRVRGLVEIATTAVVAAGTERRLNSDNFTCIVRGGTVESYQLGSGSFASRY